MTQRTHPLPECVEVHATTIEQLKNLTKDVEQITHIVFGNDKMGLKEQAEFNLRAIQVLQKSIEDMVKENKEKKAEARKFGWAVALAVITALLSLGQTMAVLLLK